MNRQFNTIAILVSGLTFAGFANAKEVMPKFGGVPIDGYDSSKDTGPGSTQATRQPTEPSQ